MAQSNREISSKKKEKDSEVSRTGSLKNYAASRSTLNRTGSMSNATDSSAKSRGKKNTSGKAKH
ncbi:hypothetical protein [Bdellovibrio sp. HCB274]|uniref:hypothetical protein n=1 Tax=Bdellovibrio sp. HCB274 TaxID=3394361 RepID=UPI0039B51902